MIYKMSMKDEVLHTYNSVREAAEHNPEDSIYAIAQQVAKNVKPTRFERTHYYRRDEKPMNRNKRLSVRLTEQEFDNIKQLAEELNMSLTDLVVYALGADK